MSEWTTVSNKKTKQRTGKGDSGTLKAAQKPVVLFISRVDPDTTKEEVENLANIHFQKTEIHCEKLKTRYNFYASFKHFADDTVLSISGSNSTELQSIVNTELEKVNEWLRFNKLSLNYSKTSYMIISRKNNQLTDFNVKINDKTITRTTCVSWGFHR